MGVSLDTFKEKMSNTTEGLVWMFETMKKTGGIDKLAPLLKEMGENGARATGTFAALANKVDFVKKQIKAANQAFEEATSCTNEYNIVNNTFQAQLDQAKKRSQALAVELGEKLAETEEDLLEHRTDGTDAFDTLYIGCEKFPQNNITPNTFNVSGVI